MQQFFAKLFGDHVILATILIAMLPIIELRGAIPFGMSVKFWGAKALSNVSSFLWSFLGSSLVVPIIALIFTPILNWLKKTKLFNKIATKFEERIKSKSAKIENDAENNKKKKSKFWLKAIGLFFFVAVPLPLTGVYTGTCIGVMLGFNFWQNCAIVISGNLCAGLIMTFVCSIFPEFTNIILYVFLGLVVVFAIFGLIKGLIAGKKNKYVEKIEVNLGDSKPIETNDAKIETLSDVKTASVESNGTSNNTKQEIVKNNDSEPLDDNSQK